MMSCYNTIRSYVGPLTADGKSSIVFKRSDSFRGKELYLPCGKCIGCKLDYSRSWAIRCYHESMLYKDNSFITLTFNDENLPFGGSLDIRAVQLFMKRLRKRFKDRKIRYFACGEYGGKLGRPHYHALIFNLSFPDKVLYTVRNGNNLYTSAILSELWPYGFSSIGDVTFESAAYVARYCVKKVSGNADEHYVDKSTGLVREKEFTTMSTGRGSDRGIGFRWLLKFMSDVYPSDEVMNEGMSFKPPRYYDTVLEVLSPDLLKVLKLDRERKSLRSSPDVINGKRVLVPDSDMSRLVVREAVKLSQVGNLDRPLGE